MAINLGDINFGLGADTRRLAAARKMILSFGDAVEMAAEDQSEGARKVEAAMRRQEAAIISSLQKVLGLNAAIRKLDGGDVYINNTTAAITHLVAELSQGPVKALDFQRSMEKFDATIQTTSRDLNTFSSSAAKAEAAVLRQQSAIFRAEQSVGRFENSLRKLNGVDQSRLAQGALSSLAAYRKALDSAGNDMLKAQAATQKFQSAMQKLGFEVQALKSKIHTMDVNATTAAFRRLADVSILLHGPLSGIATRLTLISSVADHVNVSTAAAVVGISAAAYAMTVLGKGSISATKNLEKSTQALDSMYASSVLTENTMTDLRKLADRAGADFLTVAKAFTRIEAASMGTNLEGEKAAKIFENLLFVSTKLGSSQEELGGVLKAVEQIMSKGKITAEELTGQLGDRLPGAIQIMSQALGVSTDELVRMMKAGELTSGMLEQFADTAVKRLGIDTTKAIENTVAAEARLANALLFFNANVDKAVGFTDAYVNALNMFSNALDWVGENIETIITVMGALAGAGAGLALAYYAPAVLAGFGALLVTIKKVTTAIYMMNMAFSMGGLSSIIGLVAKLTIALGGAYLGMRLMTNILEEQTDKYADAVDGIDALIDKQEALRKTPANRYDEVLKAQTDLVADYDRRISELQPKLDKARKTFDSLVPPEDPFAMGLLGAIDVSSISYEDAMAKLAELQKEWDRLTAARKAAAGKLSAAQDAVDIEAAAAATAQAAAGQDIWNEKLGEMRTKQEDALAIAKTTLEYGRDSLELTKLVADQEWRQLAAKALNEGATETQLKQLRDLYDAQIAINLALSDQEKQKNRDEIAAGLLQELDIQRTILKYGNDSIEVARVKQKYESDALAAKLRALGATEDEVDAMLKNQAAIEAAARAAGTLADNASAAIGPFQTILGIAQGIASALASLGMNTAGLKAQAEALAAGMSPTEASIEGKIAEKRTEFNAVRGSVDPIVRIAMEQQITAYGEALKEEAYWQGVVNEKVEAYNEANKKGGGGGGGAKASNTMDDALDSLKELDDALAIAKLPAWQREAATRQAEINAATDAFADKLARANIPQEKAVELVSQYRDKLTALKEAEAGVRSQINMWDELATTLAGGMDNALDAYVDAVLSGEDALESLLEVGKSVAADLLKTFMQLAWMNPLKNLLFGGDPTTGSLYPTLASSGGLLGDIMKAFGGGKAEGGPLKNGEWYVAGEYGPEPIWGGGAGAFASGYKGEGLPDSMSPAGGGVRAPKVYVNIATQPGETVEGQSSESGDGMTQMESYIITTINKAAADGRLNKGMQAGFGLKQQNKPR